MQNVMRLAAMLVLCGNMEVFAQVQAGRIVGTIYDPNRAVVPGAVVTVKDSATNISKRVVANEAGDYVVTPLNPGVYSVSATAPGFETSVRSGIELEVGQGGRVDLELTLGAPNTQVEVTSTALLLNTESGSLGSQISNEQLVELPLNGREFHELAQITPGAVLLGATGNVQLVRPEYVNGAVIGGVAGLQTSFLVDGVDVTEQHEGGTWIEPSIDALQEFSVQQNAYSAEFKRAGGAFNATTKSGSNRLHGNAFEFLRNDFLDARNFFSITRAVLKRNQFGGTLGGPVVVPHVYNGKDKTFFFISYQGMRLRQGSPANSTVPSAGERTGDFSAPGLNTIYDPLTTVGTSRSPFPGKIIPASRLAPQATFFLPYIPLPNTASGTAVYSPNSSLRREELILRADRQITTNNKLFVRWSYVDNRETDPAAFPALGTATLSGLADNIDVALTSTVRANMVNEFRYNYLIGNYRSEAYFQGTNFNQLAGITGLEGSQQNSIATLPAFSFSGYAGFSGQAGDGRPKFQDRLVNEFTDSLTWIKGRHIVKFGVDMRYFQILFTDTRSHVGSWSFNGSFTQNPASSGGTGDGFADFLLGYPNSGTRSNPATWWGGEGWNKHFFVEDDFKVSNRLTLNLGLRYEYTPWLPAYRNVVATFDGSLAKPIIVGSDNGHIDLGAQPVAPIGFALFSNLIQTNNQVGLPSVISVPDKLQFAPRIGLAWRPFGDRTVIRGGYGIFYEPESTTVRLNFNFLPWDISETVNATQNVVPTRTLADFYLGAPFGSSITNPSWTPASVHMRMGYDEHFSLGVQHQLTKRMSLEVDYAGNRGRHQQSSDAFNDPPAGPGAVQARRPYPVFGTMNTDRQDGSSQYDSLQAKLEQRLSSGIWFTVAYTWSRSFQWAENPGIGGDEAWEKSPIGYDIPQNIALSYGAALPFGKGRHFLTNAGGLANAVIGGWQLSSIVVFRSGTPFTPGLSRDVANTGVGGQRPNRTCSGQLAHPTLAKWFDNTCFTIPANYTYGNSGPGILRTDYFGSVSASLSKEFRVTETSRVQFRAEAFNLPNCAYFSGPSTSIDTSTVGRVTSTSNTPRQVQLALKYNF
ncbi:MAG TPA: carboxypeptidase regulatory-like domain-containing protein [Bryobacteraceae bacterium]|nr:carboxypeptidase regulatory-like domain-containing protein [Bryobacteraceae bacterium]